MARKRGNGLANRALDIHEPDGFDQEGADARQKLVKQHTENIDIARGGDRLPSNLFRARVIRGHHPKIVPGHRERMLSDLPFVQQFRDAEVQELGDAGRGDQDVGGLQIPMHDQVLMGVMHRGANDGEQLEPRRYVEPMGIAEGVDRNPIDVLHDQIGGAIRQGSAVQEVRDIGMIELGEDLPLYFEARLNRAAHGAPMHHLDRDALLEFGVGAFRKENLSHAARTQGADDAVRTDALSFHAAEHAPAATSRQTWRGLATRGGERV